MIDTIPEMWDHAQMNHQPASRNTTRQPIALPAQGPLGGGGLVLHAPAKINLNLLVAAPRPDGFHPVDSIIAKITLYDTLEIRPRTDRRVVLDTSGADCGPPEKNLVMRAAKLLADRRDLCGADIKLIKTIPPGAGLGGGSSDAAVALSGLNTIWSLNLPLAELSDLAAELGSDVPLFLGPPAARLTGRGEVVAPLEVGRFAVILLMSGLICSTAEVYGAYDRLGPSDDLNQIDTQILTAEPPSAWRDKLRNDLAPAAMSVCPELSLLRERLVAQSNQPVHITGSGSTMFILCDNAEDAAEVVSGLDSDLQNMCTIATRNPW
jgi:4-diphosphocytidyl-2-C-methyl-D-erythritol kinase